MISVLMSRSGQGRCLPIRSIVRGAAQQCVEPIAPSALVISRIFRFDGRLIQSRGFAHPALRLTLIVNPPVVAPNGVKLQGMVQFSREIG